MPMCVEKGRAKSRRLMFVSCTRKRHKNSSPRIITGLRMGQFSLVISQTFQRWIYGEQRRSFHPENGMTSKRSSLRRGKYSIGFKGLEDRCVKVAVFDGREIR